MVAMNRENNKRESEASSHRNNDDPTRDEEQNTHFTLRREEIIQTTTTQGLSIYSRPFSKFIMSIALLENFQLLTTLKPYDGTGDP